MTIMMIHTQQVISTSHYTNQKKKIWWSFDKKNINPYLSLIVLLYDLARNKESASVFVFFFFSTLTTYSKLMLESMSYCVDVFTKTLKKKLWRWFREKLNSINTNSTFRFVHLVFFLVYFNSYIINWFCWKYLMLWFFICRVFAEVKLRLFGLLMPLFKDHDMFCCLIIA